MIDDPALLQRKTEHLTALRAQGRAERTGGLVACAVGLAIMVVARNRFGGAPWMIGSGVGVIALGWVLFVASVARRYLWARAHPFET